MMNHPAPKVFVVDDELLISRTLAIILEQSGFAVKSYTNPLKALEAAALDRPQLLLSDVTMPDLSGIDLAIRIRQLCHECKIILISGQITSEDLADTRDLGHDFMLLPKPIHPTDLLKHIHSLVA
jgi:DNA-binding response OmpR family regulator